ncbi:potassium transporter Kup [bacterium]|nr:potassium transporter Kup [bacterium]
MLLGESVITPAISVLSAVEGLRVVTHSFNNWVVPITLVILTVLFMNQKYGTHRIGFLFGPIILIWFAVLGVMGVNAMRHFPEVLQAVNPVWAVRFFVHNGWHGVMILGTVFLVVTGGEALYADMGHFGRRPIQWAWFGVALPGLVLNYFGQGAMLLTQPQSVAHPFFYMAPEVVRVPLVLLATMASVIASQALISGVFSLTNQAIQLGYFPRVSITHTSSREKGQIYIPFINYLLLGATLSLVLFFPTSGSLAAAYGVAVTMTMAITTLLMGVVVWRWSRWHPVMVGGVTLVLLVIDGAFLLPNLAKISHGGWVPLVIAAAVMIIMSTWHDGRQLLGVRLTKRTQRLPDFLDDIHSVPPVRVPGVAVYMTRDTSGVPPILAHNFRHNRVLHHIIVLLSIKTEDVPTVDDTGRVSVKEWGAGIYQVSGRYGYMETPDVPLLLSRVSIGSIQLDPVDLTYVLGRETIIASATPGMALWREHLFAFLSKNAQRAMMFFNIPPNQVIEIGIQVEI